MTRTIAHRGYSAKFPENTLTAYQASIDQGFTHIEIDVHLSKDGVPVIMHDKTVDRTTDGEGPIIEHTLKQLKELKMNEDERIPTLEETLDFAKGKVKVAIELKQPNDLYAGLEQKVYDLVVAKDMVKDVYVNSFNHQAIVRMREIAPELELGLIKAKATDELFPLIHEIGATSLAMELQHLTEPFAEQCKQADIQLIVWPVDTKEACLQMKRYPEIWCTVNELETFNAHYMK
ncbi:glycerophosphoryl diester phosphodiesterase [Alkalihalobacillus xiaoxiensis]|uniref:Glycerophosphoryl diester phosphodiesterase n=1 Tax=Shouchella xiaoxiensis TaxID=766895 RepID=A0ABS2SUP3_9BACI|nr:glycerophosphodiester phosphodiesterase family protein [Shouchella xiaoxiensis]MBM7839273.1 glycerophosphoryl diester phosphodiesterase [Shouchella xiaoxiensis]